MSSAARSAVLGGAVLLAGGALAATGLAESSRADVAALHVTRLAPLTVSGSGFKAAESVTARATGSVTGTAKGTATAAGKVTLTFTKLKVTACSAYKIKATGARGTTATLTKSAAATCAKATATVDFGSAVVVKGSGFKPGEKLTVTLIADGTRTRIVSATAKGLLQVSFGALALSNCSAYTLKIMGSLGSKFSKSQAAVPC